MNFVVDVKEILVFFFNDTATTEIYTLSLHDALPIYPIFLNTHTRHTRSESINRHGYLAVLVLQNSQCHVEQRDRKSTRLNSSHANISYAVFCLKKKKNTIIYSPLSPPTLLPIHPYLR